MTSQAALLKPPVAVAVALAVLASALGGCRGDAAGPEAAERIVVDAGDQQVAPAGSAFPLPVRIRLLDAAGRPVAGAGVLARAEGGGWVTDGFPTTDGGGQATVVWYAGPTPGAQALTLEAGRARAQVHGTAVEPVPGATYLGHRGWVEYRPGTLPIVLTAPHGGTLLPPEVPDRTWGTFARDFATDTLALLISDAMQALGGGRPHVVRLLLHRVKLDANRGMVEAAQGDPLATRAWEEFHLWTRAAREAVQRAHGDGLYVDLHGHGHTIQRLELGYLLTAADLARPDADLDQPWAESKSSLRTLGSRVGLAHAELIRGPRSLGALFEREGYPSVPSPSTPHPSGAPYFSGGHNTALYGCRGGGSVCGVQLELNREGVRNAPEQRIAFAAAAARVFLAFLVASGTGDVAIPFAKPFDISRNGEGFLEVPSPP